METNTDKIIAITNDSRDYLQAVYLDWVNNFISIEGFMVRYRLNIHEAETLLSIGKRIHLERTNP